MDNSEAKIRFSKADRLYNLGRFEDALVELEAIDGAFPNNHRILNAQARTLARLRRYDNSLAICERLLHEFQYEKIRAFRDDLAASIQNLDNTAPKGPSPAAGNPAAAKGGNDTPRKGEGRFKIKPVRLLILVGICLGMYFSYVPIWLGATLIVGYLVIRVVTGMLFRKLVSAPFKMKGKALAGASCTLHGFQWADKPAHLGDDDGSDDDEGPEETLRYVWLDVSIIPVEQQGGFHYWEPGELMLAPAELKFKGMDSLEDCFGVCDVRLAGVAGGGEDDVDKYEGPQRVMLLVGIPLYSNDFRFVYYFEQFGQITLAGEHPG